MEKKSYNWTIVGNVKIKGSLGCTDDKMVEFSTLVVKTRAKSRSPINVGHQDSRLWHPA